MSSYDADEVRHSLIETVCPAEFFDREFVKNSRAHGEGIGELESQDQGQAGSGRRIPGRQNSEKRET